MKSAILVYILCVPTNSNALSTKPNGLSYRAANSNYFAKVGRLASEEVMVQLLKQKCLPIVLYALDVCNLDKKNYASTGLRDKQIFYEIV